MKKKYLLVLLSLFAIISLDSCSDSDTENDSAYARLSTVTMDVTQVPLPKLSDYHFFKGPMKDLNPTSGVLPYKPNSELFSDYAHKKRFVWMPKGSWATYDGDDNVLEFPVGAVLIKNFYYTDVLPGNYTKIIETRLLVKTGETTETESGWEMHDYIWNEEQTEAFLDTDGNGQFIPITFVENGVTKETTYKIPAATECATCHKINLTGSAELIIPIGVKPQNLNYNYNYSTASSYMVKNQLRMWQSKGFLDNSIPNQINSTVDWKDTSKSLELRARSYIDANCAHCHRQGAHCDYVNMRFNFSNPDLNVFGVCMEPSANIGLPYVIAAGDADNSEIILRMSSNNQSVMMPLIGRTIVHEEGVALIKDWINSIEGHCE